MGDAGMEEEEPLDRSLLSRLSASPGLCATCAHLRLAASARSVFVRCGRADRDPRYRKYPTLPVIACPGWTPVG